MNKAMLLSFKQWHFKIVTVLLCVKMICTLSC